MWGGKGGEESRDGRRGQSKAARAAPVALVPLECVPMRLALLPLEQRLQHAKLGEDATSGPAWAGGGASIGLGLV